MSERKEATRQAARTTIVGGQPPGNARDLPPVPVGLEEILALAAASREFEVALLASRDQAIRASGVGLAATERQILAAMGREPLGQMIARLRDRLPEPERRKFLERAAAAVALLVGGAALAGCGQKKSDARRAHPPEPQIVTGSRPDRPTAPGPDAGAERPRPIRPRPTRGIRPGRILPRERE